MTFQHLRHNFLFAALLICRTFGIYWRATVYLVVWKSSALQEPNKEYKKLIGVSMCFLLLLLLAGVQDSNLSHHNEVYINAVNAINYYYPV